MIKTIVLTGLVVLLLVPAAYAKDITMSVNQTEYYFLTGEEAAVPLNIINSYDTLINGQLRYTIVQEISQQGFQYSSSQTRTSSFPVEKGDQTVNIGFGTSDSPVILKVALAFSYDDSGPREVVLPELILHFVSRESEKKNVHNNVQSSSQPQQQQQQPQQQNIQQMIDRMMGGQQQQEPQDRLQNSQLSQDSSALKQQMEKQLQQQQQMKQEFQQQLEQDSDFQQAHQELVQQGYGVTGAELNPNANDSGTFELNYRKENSETATLEGEMQEGEVTHIRTWTSGDEQRMLDLLNESETFRKYRDRLEDEGFSWYDTEFSHNNNSTGVRMNYRDEDNHTASITAEIVNSTVTSVNLEKDGDREFPLWLLPLILAALIGTLLYWKYAARETPDTGHRVVPELFDHRAAARTMLDEAAILFGTKKKYKEAYSRVGQAVRLFLRYEHGLDREITSDEIIHYLKTHGKRYREIQECFDLCTLVVFARYEANERDFAQIMGVAEALVEKGTV